LVTGCSATAEPGFGGHELLAVGHGESIARIPDGITFEQTAAGTEGSRYALVDLRKAKVGPGSDVMVDGATGAIGSAAVQLEKHLGACVTAVSGTEHVDLVESLGADRVVDRRARDFTEFGSRGER
jgi:NADPH:quinone reductase-like Zn-dependent oxidoreductase